MPFITKKSSNGQELKLLIDTGTSKNYVKDFPFLKGVKENSKSFYVKSINGKNLINKHCKLSVLSHISTFYILPKLSTFDAIIGYDFLKEINAKLDLVNNVIIHKGGEEKFYLSNNKEVNSIFIEKSSVPPTSKTDFDKMILKHLNAFAEPNRTLTFNTSVKATIKTTTNEPIYSKSYPYPVSATEFINKEIKSLLQDGIIQKSCSPYNSPVHVVNKKGVDDHGKQKLRMVIDFRKINEKTIPDRYPIPDTSVILANLGKASFFTTLDLKSGFHQILLHENDRQKTAFNVNNGKYEFCRLPFGLRNAPSIFQRAIDDILRDYIGTICYVYIDDIIIYSPDAKSHISDIESIISKLESAGMRISTEKSKFFKSEVEFLGFTVSQHGIKTCPSKVQDILNYKTPETLRALRSFLGLSGYYRRFIRDYASIAKPLTKYLRGENGQIGTASSKKIPISLDEDGLSAFDKLKRILASDDVLLLHPDYDKSFELTTDASSNALGAVLSQDGRPITMISRTLSQTEENYATNERELLAIVWALQSLRHYLYGIKNIKIFTDHQPLIFAISDRNPNTKMKRWRAFIEEFSPKFFYKPGNENKVADALSRQFINAMSDEAISTVHSEISSTDAIKSIKYPVNQFRNQLIISKSSSSSKTTSILFQKFIRHTLNFNSIDLLLKILRDVVNPNVTNAIHCDLSILAEIQNPILLAFPGVKFIHTNKIVIDLTNRDDQLEVVSNEHNRAHRNLIENVKQISSQYFFPKIADLLKPIITSCKICLENKYQRKPPKPEIGKTPIPDYPGHILHIDLFYTGKQYFLTCIDKFSKFAICVPISSRATVDIIPALLQILNQFNNTKLIVSDNEGAFESAAIKTILRNNFNIDQFFVPTLHSVSNGQVERFHSTLSELARCIFQQQQIQGTIEIVLLANQKYNNTIHSVIDRKPIDVLHNCPPEELAIIKAKLVREQGLMLRRFNEKALTRTYQPGEKVFLRRNKRIGNKFQKVFIEKVIQEDLGSTVLIDGKRIHKSNLRS